MSRELYNLPPAGVNLPARYKKTINSRRLFIDGAEAGLDGRAIDAEFVANLLAKQGKAASEAYHDGHAEGTKARVLARKAGSNSP
jgi:hypothetical protein